MDADTANTEPQLDDFIQTTEAEFEALWDKHFGNVNSGEWSHLLEMAHRAFRALFKLQPVIAAALAEAPPLPPESQSTE